MKRWFTEHKGLTLVEMMVVLAILAVLAAVIVPAVTGTTSKSRATTQAEDLYQTQNALDHFNTDAIGSVLWPTSASLAGVTTTWVAGKLPTGTGPTGAGTSGSPYVFTEKDLAGLDWTSEATTSDGSKAYYPDYLKSKPRHAAETNTIANGATYPATGSMAIQKGAGVIYVQLSNTSGGPLDFPKWAVDNDGNVWVFVIKDSY